MFTSTCCFLKGLKEVAAYNVGQCLCSEHDVNCLNLTKKLEKLVKKFVNTFSGDYINNLYENRNKSQILL